MSYWGIIQCIPFAFPNYFRNLKMSVVYDANAEEALAIESASMAHQGMSSIDIDSDDCYLPGTSQSEYEDDYVGKEPLHRSP